MHRADRRRSERTQRKSEKQAAARAREERRNRRLHARQAARDQASATDTSLTGMLGDFLKHLWITETSPLFWVLARIARLMGIDTEERGPLARRPAWMPDPPGAPPQRSKR
jgi:hypothetical protein